MKKYLFISILLASTIYSKADGLTEIKALTLKGYKAIRHDAIVRLKFRKVHEMNKEIKNFTN